MFWLQLFRSTEFSEVSHGHYIDKGAGASLEDEFVFKPKIPFSWVIYHQVEKLRSIVSEYRGEGLICYLNKNHFQIEQAFKVTLYWVI